MKKFGSNTCQKEAKISKNDTENANYAKRCETKRNAVKILFIFFANWSENHAKRTVFRFHFTWKGKKCKRKRDTLLWGEILRHPENSVPQTIVVRYPEIGDKLCTKQRSNGFVFIWRIFRQEHNFFSMLPAQYITDFLVAEYDSLRNTIFWGS
jgi:hypothetical protein